MSTSIRYRMKEHLVSEHNLSADQVETMVEIASQDIRKNLVKIAASIDINGNQVTALDYETLKRAAHSLKGVLLNLGLNEEADASKKIELAAQNGESIDSVTKILSIANNL